MSFLSSIGFIIVFLSAVFFSAPAFSDTIDLGAVNTAIKSCEKVAPPFACLDGIEGGYCTDGAENQAECLKLTATARKVARAKSNDTSNAVTPKEEPPRIDASASTGGFASASSTARGREVQRVQVLTYDPCPVGEWCPSMKLYGAQGLVRFWIDGEEIPVTTRSGKVVRTVIFRDQGVEQLVAVSSDISKVWFDLPPGGRQVCYQDVRRDTSIVGGLQVFVPADRKRCFRDPFGARTDKPAAEFQDGFYSN